MCLKNSCGKFVIFLIAMFLPTAPVNITNLVLHLVICVVLICKAAMLTSVNS